MLAALFLVYPDSKPHSRSPYPKDITSAQECGRLINDYEKISLETVKMLPYMVKGILQI